MRISSIALFIFALLLTYSGRAQTTDSTVTLSGDTYAFALNVQAGWALESGHGTWSGIRAIMFPRAVSKSPTMWGNPDAWITIGIASKQSEGNLTLKNLVTFYARVDSQESKAVSDLQNLVTKDGKKAILKQRTGSDSFGALAFIEDQSIVAVFELRRFDQQQFKDAFPTFRQLVQSYRSLPVANMPAK